MAGYTRTDTTNNIADGNIINAADLDNEYNAIEAAFNASTGHTHDGTSAEGAPITKVGPTQDVTVSSSAVLPKTDNAVDLGSPSLEFKDLYIDGTANIDSLVADTADINGGTIDGTAVGASTASTGAFTTLSSSSTTSLNGTTIPSSVTLVSTAATQTLTNKTINLTNNTLVATSAQLATALTDETGTGVVVFSASPALTGTPTAPTAAAATNTTQIATTAHVFAERSNTATLTNKTLTSPTINGGTSNPTTLQENSFPVVTQTDVGTAPNQLPLNQYLGDLAYQDAANIAGPVGIGGGITAAGASVISVTDNSNAALRITQLGTGNAFVVEDATNPDATPFVIDNAGRIVVGNTLPIVVSGSPSFPPSLEVIGTSFSSSGIAALRYSADTASPSFTWAKSRSAAIGSFSAVSSGDALGTLVFEGDDGANFIRAAAITAAVDGTPGTNDMPGRLVFSTTADGASTVTERMRIDNAGNVIHSAPATAPTLATNGQMVFNLTSNTNLRVSVRGSDGVTRTADITLA
jgi:hypothetical protein